MAKTHNPDVSYIATGYDEAGNTYRMLRFVNARKVTRTVAIPMSTHPNQLLTQLAKEGYSPPLTEGARRNVLKGIEQQCPTAEMRVATQVGHADGAFVLPHRVIGDGAEKLVVRLGTEFTANSRFGESGSLQEWRVNLLPLAKGNRLVMTAIMAAFAGPIMPLLGLEAGVINLVGASSSGKTTALVVAGSVWGGQRSIAGEGATQGFSQSWLTTDNALDATLAAHNHTLLTLDETAMSTASKEAANVVYSAAHRMAGGEEKARRTDDGKRLHWCTMVLSSSEQPFQKIAELANRPVNMGQLVRFIDVQADAGQELGVFEALNGHSDAGSLADSLRDAALRYYGTAGVTFVERLLKRLQTNRNETIEKIAAYRYEFMSLVQSDFVGPTEVRISKRFATIYAAARLAREFGILTWSPEKIRNAVVFVRRKTLVDPSEIERPNPVKLTRDYIRRNKEAIKKASRKLTSDRFTNSDLMSAPGITRKNRNGKREFLFHSSHIDTIVDHRIKHHELINYLADHGLLHHQNNGRFQVNRKFPPPLKQAQVYCVRGHILDK
ncbi:DUF927 domain-containing protein [Rhodospira trueperi]|uniref:DUF927 domain-containing protein n=1 Tax=Rhodospira trueperi TaxID=69960 RepID=A0A1G7ELI5_9PROT|nr:DUF927 domain-containing protein [Rhodospira trueperi]SDE64501.1 protein of unknown function [Rhodospira trueperi]